MDEDELTRLLTQYLEYAKTEAEALFPAWNRVTTMVDRSGEDGWRFVRRLVEMAPDRDALFYIAAGPFEDLLAAHGPEVIDRVIEAARVDESLRFALGRGVWGATGSGPMPRFWPSSTHHEHDRLNRVSTPWPHRPATCQRTTCAPR
jgi:Family of unknown function (DUF6869)